MVQSDEFNEIGLNSVWTFTNPRNDATATISNGLLTIDVPGVIQHNSWGYNYAPRIMQTYDNTDIELQIKFNSRPAVQYQHEGIVIEQDSNNYIKFEFAYGGLSLHISSVTTVNAIPVVKSDIIITELPPLFMHIQRIGNQWLQSYSFDGTTWFNGTTFTQIISANKLGIFAGNAYEPTTAFIAKIDYFRVGQSCAPDYQCIQPLNGMMHDINECPGSVDYADASCNPQICEPDYRCIQPLNGMMHDINECPDSVDYADASCNPLPPCTRPAFSFMIRQG